MKSFFSQLNQWGLSANKLTLVPKAIQGPEGATDIAEQHAAMVDVYTFTYDVGGLCVGGFIALPKRHNGKLPAIIFNRGGTGNFGLIADNQLFMRVSGMASWGYIIVGSHYPGNNKSEGKDERGGKSDLAAVLKLYDLLGHLSDVEEERVGMYGESRGGMMTYLAMKEVAWIKAALTVGGLTNLERSLERRPEFKKVYENAFGNTKRGMIDRSVVHWVDKLHKSPLCLLQGGADWRVSPLDALELATKLEENRHPYSLHILEGGDHGLANRMKERSTYIKNWFDSYLKENQ